MIFFCTDLDNTLIFSTKHKIDEEKIPVEIIAANKLSFMTLEAFELLKQIALQKTIVPVTTRSLQQYLRIDFGGQVPIKYALVANGGILLENGQINQAWLQESKRIATAAEPELAYGVELLKQDSNIIFEIRKVDDLFIFTKSRNAKQTVTQLKTMLNLETVYIDYSGAKVYIFPQKLDKGLALQRFRSFIGGNNHRFIAAGDSCFDVPMLLTAELGLCPETIDQRLGSTVVKFDHKNFSVSMLSYVLNYN